MYQSAYFRIRFSQKLIMRFYLSSLKVIQPVMCFMASAGKIRSCAHKFPEINKLLTEKFLIKSNYRSSLVRRKRFIISFRSSLVRGKIVYYSRISDRNILACYILSIKFDQEKNGLLYPFDQA